LDLLPTSHFAQSLTAVKLPDRIDGKALQAHLKQKYGIEIAGGQDELAGKILRIAHLGFVDPFQLMSAFAGLELALRDFHDPVELGKSVGTLAGRLHQEW
jgi:aspartate aminotransferase-like enzyme